MQTRDHRREQEPRRLSRRQTLKIAGGIGVAAAAGALPKVALAQPAPSVPNGAGFYRFRLGAFTITLLSDGQVTGPAFPGQGANPGRQEVYAQFLRDHFIDPDRAVNNFIPMLVDTGRSKVLVDSGNGPGAAGAGLGRMVTHLQLAGVRPDEVDTVFITHGHPDHIRGLTVAGGAPAFPNARLVMGETDYTFWTNQPSPSEAVRTNLTALRSRFTLVPSHHEIVPGVMAIGTPGHTVGHMAVLVTSGSAGLMHFGDAGGHFLLSLRFPEHYLGFDADRELVVRTRREMFDRAAADRLIVVGYHFPWPGVGYIRRRETYFEFVPAVFSFS
jgi:glyoxylase-like metal-dependent hydrolase (beta-lactamase superfamily II)